MDFEAPWETKQHTHTKELVSSNLQTVYVTNDALPQTQHHILFRNLQ